MADADKRAGRKKRAAAARKPTRSTRKAAAAPVAPATPTPPGVRWIQWGSLTLALALLLIFLLSQQQTTDFRYGTEEIGRAGGSGDDDGPDPPPSTGTLPSDAAMKSQLAGTTVLRLPGAVASFDEPAVLAAIAHADRVRAQQDSTKPKIKVIVAPPDLSDADERRLSALPGDNVRIVGLSVTFATYQVLPSDTDGWQQQFVTGDVTSLILSRLASSLNEPDPADTSTAITWRPPTADELGTVVAGLGSDRLYSAPRADLDEIPSVAAQAFPATAPIVAAFPRQPRGAVVPDYASALAQLFPDTPIVVMYGYWCQYAGPFAENTDVATASYYSRYGGLISEGAFPQWNVLNVYLKQWAQIRFAGLFDRALPYQPPDPVGIALPALPWLFLGCVLVFLGASVHTIRRRSVGAGATGEGAGSQSSAEAPTGSSVPSSPWDRLAGLSSLAVEISGLADDRATARLTRGVSRLTAARDALDHARSPAIVDSQLDAAQKEFDALADLLGRPDYRPQAFLAARQG